MNENLLFFFRSDFWLSRGISGYLFGLFMKKMFGKNEYRHWIREVSQSVIESVWSLCLILQYQVVLTASNHLKDRFENNNVKIEYVVHRNPNKFASMKCRAQDYLLFTVQEHYRHPVHKAPPQVKHQSPQVEGPLICILIWLQGRTWRLFGASHILLWEWLRCELVRSRYCRCFMFTFVV